MADFTHDSPIVPPVSGLIAVNFPLPWSSIAAEPGKAFRNAQIEPNDGYLQHDIGSGLSGISSSLSLPALSLVEYPAEPGGEFLNALLAAQQILSGGPAYPITGQRWPWKAVFFYRAR